MLRYISQVASGRGGPGPHITRLDGGYTVFDSPNIVIYNQQLESMLSRAWQHSNLGSDVVGDITSFCQQRAGQGDSVIEHIRRDARTVDVKLGAIAGALYEGRASETPVEDSTDMDDVLGTLGPIDSHVVSREPDTAAASLYRAMLAMPPLLTRNEPIGTNTDFADVELRTMAAMYGGSATKGDRKRQDNEPIPDPPSRVRRFRRYTPRTK